MRVIENDNVLGVIRSGLQDRPGEEFSQRDRVCHTLRQQGPPPGLRRADHRDHPSAF